MGTRHGRAERELERNPSRERAPAGLGRGSREPGVATGEGYRRGTAARRDARPDAASRERDEPKEERARRSVQPWRNLGRGKEALGSREGARLERDGGRREERRGWSSNAAAGKELDAGAREGGRSPNAGEQGEEEAPARRAPVGELERASVDLEPCAGEAGCWREHSREKDRDARAGRNGYGAWASGCCKDEEDDCCIPEKFA
jgi:hypothetical protein